MDPLDIEAIRMDLLRRPPTDHATRADLLDALYEIQRLREALRALLDDFPNDGHIENIRKLLPPK